MSSGGLHVATAAPLGPERIRRHQWLAVPGRAARTPRGATGLALAGLVVLIAAAGPVVAPHSPEALLTLSFGKPSRPFPLGGDFLGRDVLSRVLDGGWLLLLMAVSATAIGIAAGATAGVSAAYLRGRTDGLIMRTVDVILAFPQLVFALLLRSILGPRLWLIVLAVGLTGRDRELERESNRLYALFDYVRDQAELQTREYGVLFKDDGYEFLTYDVRKGAWRDVTEDEALDTPRKLPDGLGVKLTVEARPVVLTRPKAAKDKTPQVMIFSNGDLTTFAATLERDGGVRSVTITQDDKGAVTLQPMVEPKT